MDVEQALRFVDEHRRVMMATLRSDGQPQLSPVTAVSDDQGRVLISSRETAMKVHNLRRRPRAWLCVVTERWYGDFAQLEGDVEIVSLPEAMEPLVDYYRRAAGEHPDWDDYRRAMETQKRVLLRVTIDRAGPRVSG